MDQHPSDMTSLLQGDARTLEDAEIDAEVQRLVGAVERAFGATLRSVK